MSRSGRGGCGRVVRQSGRAGAMGAHGTRSADDPAGGGGGSIVRGRGAQQQRQCAALRRGERQPPHRHAVDFAVAHFADHRVDGAAAQRFFHRPQQVAAMRGGDRHQPLGREAEGIEAGAMRRAAFGERHVLGDPEQTR